MVTVGTLTKLHAILPVIHYGKLQERTGVISLFMLIMQLFFIKPKENQSDVFD